MSGFHVGPFEPDMSVAGRVFRRIPETGALTSGDDTLIGDWVMDFVVSGGAGSDLLVLDYRGQAVRIDFDASFSLGYLGFMRPDQSYLNTASFQDFERFNIAGSDYGDTLRGALAGDSTLSGAGGDDVIHVAGGTNLARGGQGDDTIHGAGLGDVIRGGAGTDVLHVDLSGLASGVDLGPHFAGADWSEIEHFAGTLTAHDDTLRGGAHLWGADGGAGDDLLRLDYSSLDAAGDEAKVTIYGGSSHASVLVERGGMFSDFVSFFNFERYILSGTARGDLFFGGENGDELRGRGGDDTLNGGGGSDTLRGGAGNDYLSGSLDFAGVLSGGDGDDTINAYRADDTVAGGAGVDRLQLDLWDSAAGAVIDLVSGMAHWTGIEIVSGYLSRQDDVFRTTVLTGDIDGSLGIDLLAFDYTRSGLDGIEFLWGGLTEIDGAARRFLWVGGFDRLDLRGSGGNDSLTGEALNDTLDGGTGNDRLDGWSGRDRLEGGRGNDTLFGGDGNDSLYGGVARDTLVGGEGNDLLFGGIGSDTFLFAGFSFGRDTIADFEAADRIVIEPSAGPLRIRAEGANVFIRTDAGVITVLDADLAAVTAAVTVDFLPLI